MVPTSTDREHLEHTTAQAIISAGSEDQQDDDYEHLRAALHAYTDDTLHRLASATASPAIGSKLLDRLINKGTQTEEFLNDWIAVEPVAKDIGFWSEFAIRGFFIYERLEPFHFGYYPERRANQLTAIIKVTSHLEERGEGITTDVDHKGNTIEYISSEHLRELLTTCDNANVVADIITSRNITDREQIAAIISGMSGIPQAVKEGIL